MNKRTEYTLLSAALIASALVGTAVGINLHQYPSITPAEPAATITVTPAPEVVIIDNTRYGAPIKEN